MCLSKHIMTVSFILLSFQIQFGQNFSVIQPIIDQVNIDSLVHTVSVLSGEETFTMDGENYRIRSRYMNHVDNDLAADYLMDRLESYGLNVSNQYYLSYRNLISGKGRNLYAEKLGSEFPEQKYIICAHYDSYAENSDAPGADDNASGTAVVIEAARILSNIDTKYTVVFALWDEEELGMIGSQYYALLAYGNQEQILGVINMDMIAYDSDNDYRCDVHVNDIGNSYWLKDKMVEINDRHSLGLDIDVQIFGTMDSDQSSFWNRNYSAILLIEDYKANLTRLVNDFNYWYHTMYDQLFAFNKEYYHAMAKLAVGTITEVSEVDISTGLKGGDETSIDFALGQNYPNPFNPSTNISYILPSASHVKLKVYDILGNEIAVIFDGYENEGRHTKIFNIGRILGSISSGIYIYQLNTEFGFRTKKMILAK